MSAISSIGGALISGIGSLIGGERSNSAARNIADSQAAFNLEMANTQYQRGTKDLIAAGLNPMLAIGKAAPSPSYEAPKVVNSLANAMDAGISNFSALQTSRQTEANVSNVQAQTNLNNALTAKAAADTTSALASARSSEASADKTKSGSIMSNIVGSDAAKKASQYLNNALDKADDALDSIIKGTGANSAKSLMNRFSDGVFKHLPKSFDPANWGSKTKKMETLDDYLNAQ